MNHRLILGTVQMGLDYGINNAQGRISELDALTILERAYSQEITTLDTAEGYGNAHGLIGSFHKNNPRSVFKIITKLPKNNNYKPDEKVDQYCNELGVDQLDVLMFHSFDSYISGRDILNDLSLLKNQKRIIKVGVSVYTNEQADIAINDDLVDVVQFPFNLLDNQNKRGALLLRAKTKGTIVHTRSTFLQGIFFLQNDSTHPAYLALRPYLEKIREIAALHGLTILQLALSYCLMEKEISQVLIGVDSLEHLNKNLEISKYALSDEILKEIEGIDVEDMLWLNPTTWN